MLLKDVEEDDKNQLAELKVITSREKEAGREKPTFPEEPCRIFKNNMHVQPC